MSPKRIIVTMKMTGIVAWRGTFGTEVTEPSIILTRSNQTPELWAQPATAVDLRSAGRPRPPSLHKLWRRLICGQGDCFAHMALCLLKRGCGFGSIHVCG